MNNGSYRSSLFQLDPCHNMMATKYLILRKPLLLFNLLMLDRGSLVRTTTTSKPTQVDDCPVILIYGGWKH